MLYRISVTERGLTGIANIFRSRLSRLDDLLGAGTVPLMARISFYWVRNFKGISFFQNNLRHRHRLRHRLAIKHQLLPKMMKL